jgi:hypothetical protein
VALIAANLIPAPATCVQFTAPWTYETSTPCGPVLDALDVAAGAAMMARFAPELLLYAGAAVAPGPGLAVAVAPGPGLAVAVAPGAGVTVAVELGAGVAVAVPEGAAVFAGAATWPGRPVLLSGPDSWRSSCGEWGSPTLNLPAGDEVAGRAKCRARFMAVMTAGGIGPGATAEIVSGAPAMPLVAGSAAFPPAVWPGPEPAAPE